MLDGSQLWDSEWAKQVLRIFRGQLYGGLVSVALMNGFVGCQSPCNVTTKDPDGGGMIHHWTGILSPRTLFVMPAS